MSTSLIDECHRRAREARRSAETTSMPSQKTYFLELEQRWLRAAESVTPKAAQELSARLPPEKAPGPIASIGRRRVEATPFTGELKSGRAVPRRAKKFTPDRLEQIRDLVALGKSRADIAALLGVTVGSLQVTCSRLGISLRRRHADVPQREAPDSGTLIADPTGVQSAPTDLDAVLMKQRAEQLSEAAVGGQAAGASFVLTMSYRGRERSVPLPLSQHVISMLALEAQVHQMSLGQLFGAIIAAALEGGVLQRLEADVRTAA